MTILELLEEDKIKGKWVNSSYGRKYESPCPGCGGDDRFQYWPEKADGEFFWCRKCGKGGNAISYLMHFRGMTYDQAYAVSGIFPKRKSIRQRILHTVQPQHPYSHYEPPLPLWQFQANAIAKWSKDCLWKDAYVNWRKWLNEDRGLNDETIQKSNLGWIPENLYLERSDWGLPEMLHEDGSVSKLWLPAGLVIPCHRDGILQRLKIRRDDPGDGLRYYMIQGSSSTPMIIGNQEIYIIVESELDCLLLHQEAGDLVGVIALGSADMKPDKDIFDLLSHAKRILVSLDSDEAGARASWKWWMANFPNAIRWPIIKGKDPTEAYLNGLNLREWIKAGIKYERKEKLPEENKPISPSPLPADETTSVEDIRRLATAPILAIRIDPESLSTKRIISICSPDEDLAVIINLDSEETAVALRELLESPVRKVVYDTVKTIVFLHDQNIEVKGNICDVMLADQVMRAGLDNEKRTSL